MKVNIKQLSPCKRLLQIEVSPEKVDDRFKEVSKMFARASKIPGFRPGKAPQHILEMHYKDQIREEVLKRIIPDSYQQAVRENSLIPVEFPEVSEVKFEKGAPLFFKAAVEIKPSIKLGNYLGLKVSERKKEVIDEDIEKALKQLQETSARYVVIETRPARMNDYVSIDFECLTEKSLIDRRKNFWIVLSDEPVLPGFSKEVCRGVVEGLIGLERNQEKRIDFILPEDFPKKEHAGKKASFIIFLSEIKQKQIPALDDEFARSLGEFKNLNELRTTVKKDLINKAGTQAGIDLQNQIIEQLLKTSNFNVPDCLVRKQMERLVEEAKTRLLYSGMKAGEIKKQEENLRKGLKEKAVYQTKAAFILTEIAFLEKIDASEQEVEQKVIKMAGEFQRQPDELRTWLEKENLLDNLKTEIKTAKTLDFLLKRAKINH